MGGVSEVYFEVVSFRLIVLLSYPTQDLRHGVDCPVDVYHVQRHVPTDDIESERAGCCAHS